jgi:hypothetical protein
MVIGTYTPLGRFTDRIRCMYITPGEIAPTGNENCVYMYICICIVYVREKVHTLSP